MRSIDRSLVSVNSFQKSHVWLAFPYAVIKKYGDDDTSYLAALITYYGFLSLFPLIIVTTTTLQLVLHGNGHLRIKVLGYIEQYFPIIGSQLQSNIHTLGKTGIVLVISLVITLYGARGAADAVQYALNHIWQVPKTKRAGFPKAALKSLSMIIVGGIGLLSVAFLSSYATLLSHSAIYKIVPSVISLILLTAVLLFIFKIGTSSKDVVMKDLLRSAVIAGIGLQILQTFGGYIVTHELKNLSTLYGTFSVVLGLLFWIYLQTQVVLYAIQVSVVVKRGLWPRNLT